MNDYEMQLIVSNFPSIKLSYENFTHKKVYNTDLCLAIPEGKKCFAWFTTYKDENVCFIMDVTKNTQIINITIKPCCFSEELAYGTILYGTMFNNLNNTFFTIEDIFYYKGRNIATRNWGDKNNCLLQMMNNDVKQVSYNRRFIVFGLPLFSRNLDELLNDVKSLNYTISNIQYRKYSNSNNYYFTPYAQVVTSFRVDNAQPASIVTEYEAGVLNKKICKNVVLDYTSCSSYNKINTSVKGNVYQVLKNKQLLLQSNKSQTYKSQTNKSQTYKSQNINRSHISKSQVVFKITSDIQNDIYNLHSINHDGSDCFCGLAHIPNFNTSVMMNKFYRNIKENINLDMLEESDSEDEFENDDPLQFVNLTKTYNFICAYNNKFRKWYPIQLAQDNMPVIQQNELLLLEKNKH